MLLPWLFAVLILTIEFSICAAIPLLVRSSP